MTTLAPDRRELEAALAENGLVLRGGFEPQEADRVPAFPDGKAAQTLWLVGITGSEFWPAFAQSAQYRDGRPDPLDRWSACIGAALAARFGGMALYPFGGPPFHPFAGWAQRAEPLGRSPLGLLLHPRFGLWHSYRFALAFREPAADAIASSRASAPVDICLRCTGQPCLSACPVDAFTAGAYDVAACKAHVRGDSGGRCLQTGCLARAACPVGTAYHYAPEHAAFHMRHFAGLERER
jgi:hypothetical protein